MRLRALLLCLLAVTAGCLGPAGDGPGTDGVDTDGGGNAPATGTPVDDAPESDGAGTPDFSCNGFEPVPRLELYVSRYTNATLTMIDAESGETVLNRTVSGGEEVVYESTDGPFEWARSYRVIVRTNGSVGWDRTVRHTERFRVRVDSDGNVTAELTAVVDSPTPCPN
jgi:hypothetical protein